MYQFKLICIRCIATIVSLCRYRSIRRARVKWIVVTGSVGKTITRQTLARVLCEVDVKTVSLETNYVNELGVLCTLFDIKNFSFLSLKAWKLLLTKPPTRDSYLLIELGADFRLDISWFLKYIGAPYVTIVTPSTQQNWTGCIPQVELERQRLVSETTGYVILPTPYISLTYAQVTQVPLHGISGTNDIDIYEYPVMVTKAFCEYENIPLQQAIIPYSRNRLKVTRCKESTIISETYKVTPLCLENLLIQCLGTRADTHILIMSEIRPHLLPPQQIYSPYIELLKKFDEVYFLGNREVYAYLQSECDVQYVDKLSLVALQSRIQNQIQKGSQICLGIKVSEKYTNETLQKFMQ